jgi:hypothetical protein
MSNFIHITPFMHVHDLQSSADIFQWHPGIRNQILCFLLGIYRSRDHRLPDLRTDGTSKALLLAIGAPLITSMCATSIASTPNSNPSSTLSPMATSMAPSTKPTPQRELLVLAPDGNLIAFGQAVTGHADASG